jgi:hypothetical protein
MQLILAIDSDPRRSEQLANLVRARLRVDLVQATSAGEGLHALRDRVPDLILTSPLLSPFDDGVIDEYLRDLGSAATHVQTVRIPMLSSGPRKQSAATRLFSLGRKKKQTSLAAPDGCDPKVFADEIAHYLTRSLEQRSASAKATANQAAADQMPRREPDVAEPIDAAFARDDLALEEWGAPPELVEEFRAPIEQAPKRVEATPAIEEAHVPGSILDLRPASPKPPGEGGPVVHAPAVGELESEPYVETEPTTYVMPEPTYVKPEPIDSAQGRPLDSAQGKAAIVEPAAVSAPVPAATTGANSASFEAALAAIRAAWAKPEPTASRPEPKPTAPAQPPSVPAGIVKPLGGSGEVDLTNEIDSLEDLGSGTAPAADENGSPDGSTTPNGRRKTEKPNRRQEKPRGGKLHGADGRDEWGAFDPNQCEISTLVNTLDDVADSDEPRPRTTNLRRW